MKKVYKLSLTLLAIICSFLFMQGNTIDTFADDSITLTIDTSNISLNLATTSSTGKFAESTPANISVSTTSTSGYTLSIASSTGSTDLTNTTDNTSKLTSISNNLTNTDFSSSSNTQYNNQWGYKPSQYVTTSGDTHTTHTNTGANAVFKPLPGQAGEILAITEQANQQNSPDTYTISMGARVNNTIPTGSYQSNAFVIMAVANKSTVPCDDTKLCVQFDGNGLTFPETDTQIERFINNVNYDSPTTIISDTKYSHTSNINDAGVQSGDYPNNLATKDVITIPGASELSATITYGTENSWDMLYVFQGEYTGTIGRNMDQASTGWLYKYMGGKNTTTTVTITIPGDTATFGFYSDSGGQYYGYYAVVTALPVRSRTLTSGEYATPAGTNAIFHGWSTAAATPGAGLPSQVEYADESEVKSKMPGNNGEEKVLYAVWQQEQEITFTKDSNVSSIEVLNSDGTTAGTITTSGQSLVLAQGNTYTLKPTHVAGYGTNAITLTSGSGTINGKEYTVGAGVATINITSKQFCAGSTIMQNLTSSTLATLLPSVGSTATVCDIRDGQNYRIGKLKDNKYWMLENLNLAGETALSASDTNVESSYISSFSTSNNLTKSGSTIVLPASSTSGFDTNNYSYVYNSGNKTNCGAEGQNTPCYSYYSWDAATLGSGRSISTDDTDAQQSICPKGWKLPTSRTTSATNWQTTSGFYALAHQYGLDSTTQTYESDNGFYTQAGPGTTPNFLLAGSYYYGSFSNGDSNGSYWSSTSYSSTGNARNLYFDSSRVSVANYSSRRYGFSVRCLASS